MPTYQIRAPNGKAYRIDGPEGATDEQVRAEVLRQYPDAGSQAKPQAPPRPKPQPGQLDRMLVGNTKVGDPVLARPWEPVKKPAPAPKPKPTVAAMIHRPAIKPETPPPAGVTAIFGEDAKAPTTLAETMWQADDAMRQKAMDIVVAATSPEAVKARQDWLNAPIAADGLGDRVYQFGKKSALRVGSGGARVLAAGMNAIDDGFGDALTQRANDVDTWVNRKVEGETTLNDLRTNFSLSGLGSFVAEQGAGSAADMALLSTGAGIVPYFVSQSGNIGQDRADNNGTGTATLTDIVKASPAAAASTAAERLGTKYLFRTGAGDNLAVRLGKSALSEAGTEAVQGFAEYTGGTLGTDRGFDLGTAGQVSLDSAITGGLVGPAMRGVLHEGPAAVRTAIGNMAEARAAQAEREAFSPLAQALAIDAFRPTGPSPETAPDPALAPRQVVPAPVAAPEPAAAPVEPAAPNFAVPQAKIEFGRKPAPVTAPEPPKPAPVPKPQPVPAAAATSSPAAAGPEAQPVVTNPPVGDGGLRPAPGEVSEGEKLVSTPAGNQVRTKFEVVPASQLKLAEGELQNRDRTGNATELQVQSIISQFDPNRLGDSTESDRGAPIIGPDDVVESGNGRTMVLNRLYGDPQYAQKAQAYKDFIISQGYNIDGIENPVLVRRRLTEMTDAQRRQFVIDSNKDAKQSLSATETARSDRDNLTPTLMSLYRGGDLNKAENASFVRQFFGKLTDNELKALIDQDTGRPTATGARRINAALLAKAYGDSPILTQMIDSNDDNVRALTGAMLDVVGPYANLRDEIEAGNIRPEMDINAAFVEAVERVSEARRQGQKIGDVLAQQDAFNTIDPMVEQIIRSFYNEGMTRPASRTKVAAIVRRYTELASEQTTGVDLLGESKTATPAEIFAMAVADQQDADMFAAAAEDRAGPLYDISELDAADNSDDGAPAPALEYDRAGLKDPGPYDPQFGDVSYTNRQSIYTGAARALGLDPAKFRLLPSQRQVALLRRLIFDRFGVSVEVAGNLQDRFAIDQMLDMLQNVQAMAHILGLGGHAISLGGNLGLKLEPGNKRYLGMYDPGARRIHLPKRSNSFAHEWGHALDFFLLEEITGGLSNGGLSGKLRSEGSSVPPNEGPAKNVRDAFVKLLNNMFFDKAALAHKLMELEAKLTAAKTEKQKAALQAQIDNIKAGSSQSRSGRSQMYKNAKALQGDYWQMPTEMLARSFEAYVSYRVELLGLTTEFIGKGDKAYLSDADDRLRVTFPKGAERDAIFEAYDDLFATINEGRMLGDGRAPVPETGDTDPMHALDKLAKAFPRSLVAREAQAWRERRLQKEKSKAGRANDPKGKFKRFEDFLSWIAYSMAGRMRMISRHWKSPSVMTLHNLLTYSEGKASAGRNFMEAVALHRDRNLNRLANIMRKHDLPAVMTEEQDKMLRDLLITQEAEDAPDNFVAAASEIRKLLDAEFYENQNVGLNIGYVRNGYLPRMLDLPKIDYAPDKFLGQAAKVYEVVFDNAFGTDPEALLNDEANFKAFLKLVRQLSKVAPIDTDAFRDASRKLNKLIAQQAKSEEPDAFDERIAKATEELVDALGELMTQVRPIFAKEKAERWLAKIHSADAGDFDAHTPDGSYMKKRDLPPEADVLMQDFYINNPIEAVTIYLTNSAKRTEYARTFGPNGETRKALFDRIRKEGVSVEDQAALSSIVDIATGRKKSNIPRTAQGGLSLINAFGTIVMLPRAVIASLSETLTFGIRTGNAINGVKALAHQIAGALGSANGKDRAELARALGIVADGLGDDVNEARYGGVFGDYTRWDAMVTSMFKWTGLTALTRSQRTHLLRGAHAYLDNLAGKALNGTEKQQKAAEHALRELGVTDVESFAKAMLGAGPMLRIDEIDTAFGKDFTTAAFRLINQTIQNPTVMDRPEAANNPVGRVVFGIMSFSYAYYRNIIKRQAVLFNETRKLNGNGSAVAALAIGFLPAAIDLYIMQLVVSTIREFLTNRDRWEEDEEKGTLGERLLALAFTRTFAFGGLDPIIQGYTGLKYQRDLTGMFVGPHVGYYLSGLQKMLQPFVRNSAKTNTAEYQAAKGVYQTMVAPTVAFGLARLPLGPITGPIAGAGIAGLTSPQAANEAAEIAAGGEKGSKTDPETGEVIGPPSKNKAAKAEEDAAALKEKYGY